MHDPDVKLLGVDIREDGSNLKRYRQYRYNNILLRNVDGDPLSYKMVLSMSRASMTAAIFRAGKQSRSREFATLLNDVPRGPR